MSFIEGRSIGEAYIEALKSIIDGKIPHWYITVHISKPILETSTETIPTLDIEDWLNIINVESEVYKAFAKFQFSKQGGWSGGKSGKDWINGRIRDLLHYEGYYSKALKNEYSFDQLAAVETRLSAKSRKGKPMHGGSTNALVCQVFTPQVDLKRACSPRPQVSGVRCLSMIDFKPKRDTLNLMAVFRSQYFDTKAYGNFISLAILLYNMSQKTGYKPGVIISTANNITFDGQRDSLYKHFKDMRVV